MAVNDSGPILRRRAELVVQCACDVLGLPTPPSGAVLRLDLTVSEFETVLKQRYGETFPELVYRSESAIERARLERDSWPELPKIVLRQGAPVSTRRRGNGQP